MKGEKIVLKNKTIVVGITGSIAAFKAAQLVSDLVKQHADVHVVMTHNALNFIHPVTFETLTKNKCLIDTFDRDHEFHVTHVSLPQKADLMVIAPASANIIGKLAGGIADDMLSTMALAATCKIMIAPAMNKEMYLNPIVQDNIRKLRNYGFLFIDPAVGRLACADVGIGKLADVDDILEGIIHEIACTKDMCGLKVLVDAGPTAEAIDPVRFITNHSSGKMGYAVAAAASARGAEVTLVSGPTAIKAPGFVRKIDVTSAEEMYHAMCSEADLNDIIITAAAVADYTPLTVADHKLKKSDSDMSIALKRTPDILAQLGKCKRPDQTLCGFSMETHNLLENSAAKLQKKNCDLMVANSIADKGSGFGTDTNMITIITKDDVTEYELMSKTAAADIILDRILAYRSKL